MRTRKFVIPAGEALEIAVNGDYLRVTASTAKLYVERDGNGDKIELLEGEDVESWPYKVVRISHDEVAEKTVRLTMGKGSRVGSAKVGGSVSLGQGGFTQGRASVTNANQAILAANATRKFLMVQNNDASQVLRVRLDGNAATDTAGFRIGPGDSLDLSGYQPTGAVNAMMEAATVGVDNVEFCEG